MAIYVFLGLRHSFIADFSLLSAAMSMHFGTFNSCFHAKMTNYYSTLLIVFSIPASVLPFTLLLLWCRRDHQSQGRGSNTSSSATGPPEPLCLPPWWWVGCQSSQHVIQRKEMVSSLSPVLWARARDPRPRPPSAPRSPAQVRAHTSLTSLAITSCSRGHILSWTALMRISSSITGRDIYRVLKINASLEMERNWPTAALLAATDPAWLVFSLPPFSGWRFVWKPGTGPENNTCTWFARM